ncbi:ribonuclease H2, subunit C [Mycena floridula]|nr:ribonuclease H2, subunit C [Mycena floridula]
MAPALEIASLDLGNLPQSSPNLMPFHIDMNGPAPISTYFLVETAKENIGGPEKPAEPSESPDIPVDASVQPPEPSPESTRFTSSFRGRQVHGLTVELPKGYLGVVMDSGKPASNKSKKPVVVQKRGSTRSATKAMKIDEDEDEEMDMDGELEPPAKMLKATSQFSSMVIWSPDIPVNDGQDEYMRAMDEWTRLADVIHCTEV